MFIADFQFIMRMFIGLKNSYLHPEDVYKRQSPDGATGHHPVAGVSRTGVRNHRGKGGVRLPRARRTGKVCTGTVSYTHLDVYKRQAYINGSALLRLIMNRLSAGPTFAT